MKNSNYSIGIFDSGLGGLTVLRALKQKMPNEHFIYFGDTAHIPYGNKSVNTIQKYCLQIIDFLIQYKIKLIVVACNSASAVALQIIKQHTSIPIIDVISPCTKEASAITKVNKIGIIGTETTIKSKAYQLQIKSINNNIKTYGKACPLFVPIIEEGLIKLDFVNDIVKFYLKDLITKKIDLLILGCTHYPILKHIIQNNISSEIHIIDSAKITAKHIEGYLQNKDLARDITQNKKDYYFVSDKVVQFNKISNMFLNKQNINIKQICL